MSQVKEFELVRFEKEKKYVNDFIRLPRKLYSGRDNMEDPEQMRKILLGEHPLSKDFRLAKFLVYEKSLGKVVGRFAITSYDNDDNAYIGFFECVDDDQVAAFLFKSADAFCTEHGYHKIIGPVDGSFWIKYRLKVNRFEGSPYTGEPYNKDYYLRLFMNNGYQVAERYVSSDYEVVKKDYESPKLKKRYDEFMAKGYEIISPTSETYDEIIGDVYRLITELYSSFPVYKHIDEDVFREMFKSYKSIMYMDVTKIVYYKGKAVAFYVNIPDYGNTVYHLNLPNILKVLRNRKKPKRIILLYMGVEKEHLGLGAALIHAIQEELKKLQTPSIGALCRQGKITQFYESNLMTDTYEYVLLSKDNV